MLMICGEIIGVYHDNYTEHTNNSKQNVKILTSDAVGVYRHHCALTLRRLMSYIYGAPILDVSRSHTTTQHSR